VTDLLPPIESFLVAGAALATILEMIRRWLGAWSQKKERNRLATQVAGHDSGRQAPGEVLSLFVAVVGLLLIVAAALGAVATLVLVWIALGVSYWLGNPSLFVGGLAGITVSSVAGLMWSYHKMNLKGGMITKNTETVKCEEASGQEVV
jgi:hypothetical protein